MILGLGIGLFITIVLLVLTSAISVFSSTGSSLKYVFCILSVIITIFLWTRTEVRLPDGVEPPPSPPNSTLRLHRIVFTASFAIILLLCFVFLFIYEFSHSKITSTAAEAHIPPLSEFKFPSEDDEEWEDVYEEYDVRKEGKEEGVGG
ncbi:hypothetical protein P9112_000486 [Eukaryota sp. TZLM1-RC]